MPRSPRSTSRTRGEHLHAVCAIGEPANGNGEQAVKGREVEPSDQAELAVRHAEVVLSRLGQDRQKLPVEKVQHINEAQDCEHRPCARLRARRGRSPGCGSSCRIERRRHISRLHFRHRISCMPPPNPADPSSRWNARSTRMRQKPTPRQIRLSDQVDGDTELQAGPALVGSPGFAAALLSQRQADAIAEGDADGHRFGAQPRGGQGARDR